MLTPTGLLQTTITQVKKAEISMPSRPIQIQFFYSINNDAADQITDYLEIGRVPSSAYIKAILENDLIGAVEAANGDLVAINQIGQIALYLKNEAPAPAWGSTFNYNRWLVMRQREMRAPELDVE